MPKTKSKNKYGLSVKRELFCQKYIEFSGNGTKAYKAAFACPTAKYATIATKASVLLNDPNVKDRIQQLRSKMEKKYELKIDKIYRQIENIIDADIRDYVEFDGKKASWKPFDELTDDQAAAIESIKMTPYGPEIKLHSKTWSLERACKLMGYDKPVKVDATIKDERVEKTALNDIDPQVLKEIRQKIKQQQVEKE